MDRANALGLRFHHLGLAVRRPRDATRFLTALGYDIPEPVFDPAQNVHLILCRHRGAMPDVEIIYPADSRSPADAWIKLHPDGLVYHMCYVAADIAAALTALEDNGMRAVCMAPPTPAVLFGGCPVAFYNIVGMGLCEIIEDPRHTVD
ncbi:MAG TPA: VOC family protein [Stellaceae bacterium]|nr:VOC family protein [Stellaceae bacterium]